MAELKIPQKPVVSTPAAAQIAVKIKRRDKPAMFDDDKFRERHNASYPDLLPASVLLDFVELAMDVSRGAKVIGQILAQEIDDDEVSESFDDDDVETAPILSNHHRSILQKLVTRSHEMFESEGARLLDWAYETKTPEGRLEAVRMAHLSRLVNGEEKAELVDE